MSELFSFGEGVADPGIRVPGYAQLVPALGEILIAFMRTGQDVVVTASPYRLLQLAGVAGMPVAIGHRPDTGCRSPHVRLYTVAGMVSLYEDMALDREEIRFVKAPARAGMATVDNDDSDADRRPIATGDTVRLKSGGPPMTVARIHEGTEEAECLWFSGGSALGSAAVSGPVERKFPIVALVRVEPA